MTPAQESVLTPCPDCGLPVSNLLTHALTAEGRCVPIRPPARIRGMHPVLRAPLIGFALLFVGLCVIGAIEKLIGGFDYHP